MASRSTSSRNGTTTSNVRRNLFHHHLSRRPASASTSTSATTFEAPTDSSSDIVSRDQNGNYQVETQVIPPIGEEQQQLENDENKDKQKIEASLVEMMYKTRRPVGEPSELLALVQASLKHKVESLDEDKWMYEAEEEVHG